MIPTDCCGVCAPMWWHLPCGHNLCYKTWKVRSDNYVQHFSSWCYTKVLLVDGDLELQNWLIQCPIKGCGAWCLQYGPGSEPERDHEVRLSQFCERHGVVPEPIILATVLPRPQKSCGCVSTGVHLTSRPTCVTCGRSVIKAMEQKEKNMAAQEEAWRPFPIEEDAISGTLKWTVAEFSARKRFGLIHLQTLLSMISPEGTSRSALLGALRRQTPFSPVYGRIRVNLDACLGMLAGEELITIAKELYTHIPSGATDREFAKNCMIRAVSTPTD